MTPKQFIKLVRYHKPDASIIEGRSGRKIDVIDARLLEDRSDSGYLMRSVALVYQDGQCRVRVEGQSFDWHFNKHWTLETLERTITALQLAATIKREHDATT